MRRRPLLSVTAAALAAALVGLVLVSPASAGTASEARWSSMESSRSATVDAQRREALEAAADGSTGHRAYAGASSLKACYGTDRTSGTDGTALDAATYSALHGCLQDGSWLFRVGTHGDFLSSDLRSLAFVADTDGTSATGCGGYEHEVFGYWSASRQELLAGVFATPDCETSTLTVLADIQHPTAREIGLQFRHAEIGGGSTVRWYGEIRSQTDAESEFLPRDGAHVESGFGSGTTSPSPAPTGADGCPTSGNSWYAATSDPDAVRDLRAAGLDDVRRVRGGLVAFTGDRGDAQEVLDGVAVRRDLERRLHVVPSDPGLAAQWALGAVRAPEAWDLGRGSRDVVVAVIDSGVDATHPDLQGQLLPGYDATRSAPLPPGNTDPVGHGTASAGVIAAATDNGSGLASLGWSTRVLPIKVEDAEGGIRLSYVVNALRYAADAGAAVINLSLGSCVASDAELAAVRYAQGKGALVVASAGNEFQQGNPVEYPAAYPGVLAVGATGRDGSRAVYSNTGSYVDLVAPGGNGGQGPENDVVMLRAGGGTFTAAGTSFSAPMVAAAAALVKAARPDLTGTALGDVLTRTARDAGSVGRDDAYGAGSLDAASALQAVVPATTAPTTAPPTAAPTTAAPTTEPPTTPATTAPAPQPDAAVPGLTVSSRTPTAGQPVRVEVRTTPGALVDLHAYSRPSTTYRLVRQGAADSDGVVVFSVLPSTNTRLYATATSQSGRAIAGSSTAVTVSARVGTPAAARRSALVYRFSGSTSPARSGVVVTLYHRAASGSLVKLADTRTTATGRWSLDRRFAKAASLVVVARTSADATNGLGTSVPVKVAVR